VRKPPPPTAGRALRATTVAALALTPLCFGQGFAPTFQASVVEADADAAFRCLLDYDGDGRVDAVSALQRQTSGVFTVVLRGYRNDGTGRLVADWSLTLPTIYAATAAPIRRLDLDGDGRDDFVFALRDAVGGWLSNGAGIAPTLAWWTFLGGADVLDVAVADFDLDGDDDFATISGSQLKTFVRDGAGQPTPVASLATAVSLTTWTLAAADLDGVPPLDLATTVVSGAQTFVRRYPVALGGGLGGFVETTLAGAGTPSLVAGDLDADGDADLLVGGLALASVFPGGGTTISRQVLRRAAPATFVVEPSALGDSPAALVDLDLDGDLDVVGPRDAAAGVPGSNGPNELLGEFRVQLHANDGAPLAGFTVRTIGVGPTLVADLDLDGDPDVVRGRCVYYAGGAAPPPVAHGLPGNRTATPVDFDGDGDDDLYAAASAVVRNDGSGGFAAAPSAPLLPSFLPNGLALDFDGDGAVDFVAESAPSSVTAAAPRRYRNRGDGTFEDLGLATPGGARFTSLDPYTLVGGPASLGPDDAFVADVDGDGDSDVVTKWYAAPGPRQKVWENDGAGLFAPGPPIDQQLYPVGVADVDGDGAAELLAVAGSLGTVALWALPYDGAGGFALPGAPGLAPIVGDALGDTRVGVGDLDGDGDVDLVVPLATGPLALRNVGDGSFRETAWFASAGAPPSRPNDRAFVADCDRDGLVDVVVGNPGYAVTTYFRRASSVAFAEAQTFAVGAAAVSDVDGDGDLDLVERDRFALHRRFVNPGAGLRLQYGAGSPGLGGVVPVLGARGPFRDGDAATLRVAGGRGGAAAFLVVGAAPLAQPLFGATLLATPEFLLPFTLDGPPDAAGRGTAELAFVVPPWAVGLTFFHQAAFADAGAAIGFATTQGLLLTYAGAQ
jgi:hypothetical protein